MAVKDDEKEAAKAMLDKVAEGERDIKGEGEAVAEDNPVGENDVILAVERVERGVSELLETPLKTGVPVPVDQPSPPPPPLMDPVSVGEMLGGEE